MDTDSFFANGSASANGPAPGTGLSPDADDLLRRLRAGELVPPPARDRADGVGPEPQQAKLRRPRLRDALAERLPVGMRGAHIDPALRGALGLGLIALIAALAALGLAWRSAPQPVAASAPPAVTPAALPPSAAALPASSAVSAATASPAAAAGIVVDVAGKVRHPGVVSLPAGSRVADAIEQAGGVLPGTDTSALSLARKVADGEQVLVTGKPGTAPASSAAPTGTSGTSAGTASTAPDASSGAPLDLNTATVDQLDGLPGVGPVLAGRIVEYRTAHNGFTSTDQLREVKGLGGKTGEELLPLVRVG